MAHVNDFVVDMKCVSLSWPKNRPYVVGYGHEHGFGAKTEAECLALAESKLAFSLERFKHGVGIEVARICPTCRADGRKPGCKRKRCEVCKGWGTVDRFGFVVLADHVDPLLAEEGIHSTIRKEFGKR